MASRLGLAPTLKVRPASLESGKAACWPCVGDCPKNLSFSKSRLAPVVSAGPFPARSHPCAAARRTQQRAPRAFVPPPMFGSLASGPAPPPPPAITSSHTKCLGRVRIAEAVEAGGAVQGRCCCHAGLAAAIAQDSASAAARSRNWPLNPKTFLLAHLTCRPDAHVSLSLPSPHALHHLPPHFLCLAGLRTSTLEALPTAWKVGWRLCWSSPFRTSQLTPRNSPIAQSRSTRLPRLRHNRPAEGPLCAARQLSRRRHSRQREQGPPLPRPLPTFREHILNPNLSFSNPPSPFPTFFSNS